MSLFFTANQGKRNTTTPHSPLQAITIGCHGYKKLLVHDIKADTPEVPLAFDPQWEMWVREVERFDIGPDTTLVGHSCGGGFWIRYLSEHKDIRVDKVVLVAPSLGRDWDERGFFDFTIDPGIAQRAKNILIFYADNDRPAIQEAVASLQQEIPGVELRLCPGMGHFTHEDMASPEFPELLQVLLA
jgi:pimeloyl-ACP methyl ester carboxylesterase